MANTVLLTLAFVMVASSAAAAQRSGDGRHRHWREACLRGGWNHPACDRIEQRSSMDYYYHHDPRHAHGMAFGP